MQSRILYKSRDTVHVYFCSISNVCNHNIVTVASNVLLKYRCGCGDVFRCVCPEDLKCLVQLSDFDSVKPFQWKEFVNEQKQELDWSLYVHMNSKECKEVMGTPGYRAPEVYIHTYTLLHIVHTIIYSGTPLKRHLKHAGLISTLTLTYI